MTCGHGQAVVVRRELPGELTTWPPARQRQQEPDGPTQAPTPPAAPGTRSLHRPRSLSFQAPFRTMLSLTSELHHIVNRLEYFGLPDTRFMCSSVQEPLLWFPGDTGAQPALGRPRAQCSPSLMARLCSSGAPGDTYMVGTGPEGPAEGHRELPGCDGAPRLRPVPVLRINSLSPRN